LVQLRHLSAYSCQITNLDDIKPVKHLESLMLQQNGVDAIPIFFSSLNKLRELRLDRNKLLIIDNLSSCSSLRTLDISYNSISSLDGIAGLQSLQEFRATNNKITSLKPLRALPSLIELDVAYNEVLYKLLLHFLHFIF
jgi:Leucine-rich repeat (LRR) protein